jgi:hypothetical protein
MPDPSIRDRIEMLRDGATADQATSQAAAMTQQLRRVVLARRRLRRETQRLEELVAEARGR